MGNLHLKMILKRLLAFEYTLIAYEEWERILMFHVFLVNNVIIINDLNRKM